MPEYFFSDIKNTLPHVVYHFRSCSSIWTVLPHTLLSPSGLGLYITKHQPLLFCTCINVVISYTYSIKLSFPCVWLLGILYGVKNVILVWRPCPSICPFVYLNTGLFISPSGISELDCATTKKDTAERSISIGRESLKVFFCTRGLGVLAGSTARG